MQKALHPLISLFQTRLAYCPCTDLQLESRHDFYSSRREFLNWWKLWGLGAGWLPGWLPIKRLHRRDNIGRRILFGDICSKLNLLNIVREIGFRRTWPTFHPTQHPSCYILVSTASSTNSSSTTAPWGCAWLWRWVADTPTHEYTSPWSIPACATMISGTFQLVNSVDPSV